MPNINNYSPASGRVIKENNNIVNIADIMDGVTAKGAVDITPNDTGNVQATLGVYIGVPGDLRVRMQNGSIITFSGLSSGIIHPISITRVYATGTTAQNILGVY